MVQSSRKRRGEGGCVDDEGEGDMYMYMYTF